MKIYLFVLPFLLASLSFKAVGQSTLTEQQVKTMLCHKWKAISMKVQGEQIPADEDVYITFLINGTFTDSQEDEKARLRVNFYLFSRQILLGMQKRL